MGQYAAQTEVSSDRSRAEIERTLERYGANGFMYGWQESNAVIAFQMSGKMVKFILPLPNKNDEQYTHWRPGGGQKLRAKPPNQALAAWEQACRQKWRALALCIKAKLESVESGIVTFEKEFLAHFVLPGGQTFGDYAVPQLEKAVSEGRMPRLLLLESTSDH